MDVVKNLNNENLERISCILKNGDLVAIPTETVYGLAANALNANAVKKIFVVKGRPADNPLIIHVSNLNMMKDFVAEIPYKAKKLAAEFWPGPLTIILKRSKNVPAITTGGLESVAIRIPSHHMALTIINYVNMGLAAPSANLSGKPSPTTAKHCVDDLNGKVDVVVDGGVCNYGVESTVISLVEENPIILRPGIITKADIEKVIGEIDISKSVVSELSSNFTAASPGMKYKHYSPAADVILVKSDLDLFAAYVNKINDVDVAALVFEGEEKYINKKCFTYGRKNDYLSQSKKLFMVLRDVDNCNIRKVYVRCPSKTGIGLAIYNRLIRAANFNLVTLNNGK